MKHDRLRLIEAQAQDKPELTLLIASVSGANEKVVGEVATLGGSVRYRDDDVSYLRVVVPTSNIEELAYSDGIEAININGTVDYLNSYPDEATDGGEQHQVAAPNRDTPSENPYLPSREIGAPQFMVQHPTFDGRGVTVAIIDTSIDLLLPELQTAQTLNGRTIPKFADVSTAVPSAIVPNNDDSRISGYIEISMREEVIAVDRRVRYKEDAYVVPGDQRYRIGMLDERISDRSGDLNRDGNPAGSSGLFAVLWDEATNTVWVDTNQDRSFADEKPMTDYRLNNDIGIFGKDNPATAVRETVGFVVQTDIRNKLILIIPGYGGHGTGIAGAAFGKGFFGGKVNGVAPEAQIVSLPFGSSPANITSSSIESVIIAMKDPRVDIVSLQFGNYLQQNDGRSTFSLICDRLVQKYQKLIFVSGGNGTDGINAVPSPADAMNVMAVGSYIGKETGRVNYGVELPRADNVDAVSARGPNKEGVLKPDILAPSVSLSTKPGFLPGDNYYGTYSLPSGYQVYGGTSTSCPIAAAAAALLISAAKQSGVSYDADRLRWAIMSSARFLPEYRAEEQGAGLLQVGAAWEALKVAPKPVQIISIASVRAVLSEYLRKPNQGSGIYEREGWTTNQSEERTITFTRTSGELRPINYALHWIGNDGTYSSPQRITLPLNESVDIKVNITPKTMGVHSAILSLDGPGPTPAVYQVMNTIVAADRFNPANRFTVSSAGHTDWFDSKSYFIDVPVNTPALRIDVKIYQGNVRTSLASPKDSSRFYNFQNHFPILFSSYQTGGAWSRVVSQPDPGVWQIVIDNKSLDRSLSMHNKAIFAISASLLGVDIHATELTLDTTTLRPGYMEKITYRNQLASFNGGVCDTSLSSSFSSEVGFKKGSKQQTFVINVPPGATSVGARLGTSSEGLADLDLYLFDCTGNECVLKDFRTGNRSNAQVEVKAPNAGIWKVIVDPFSAPDSEIRCYYVDYFTHPAFGTLRAIEEPTILDNGTMASQRVSVEINALPVGNRHLAGLLTVVSEVGANTDSPLKSSGDEQLCYPLPDGKSVCYPKDAILGTSILKIKNAGLAANGQ